MGLLIIHRYYSPGATLKIKSVRVINFRALQDVNIEFDSITTFIGPNGSGKSTVLRALDWFFNGKPGDLDELDCSLGNVEAAIEVGVTFHELSRVDRDELGKYAPDDVETVTIWKIRDPNGEETISANAKGFPDFNNIKATTAATPMKELYKKLRADRPELELPAANSRAAIEASMTTWEAQHPDLLENVSENLQSDFFGFNSSGKMSGLFDYVLVTADLRASEEAADARSSIVGRILERSIDRTAADEEVAEIVERSRQEQNKVYREKFEAPLKAMTEQLNETIGGYSPGRSIAVKPAELELKAPRTTFDLSILDGSTETPVDRQGHGFQRTLLISALQVLAKAGAASNDGVICLAIEEPELFQHPSQAAAFSKVLRSLAEDEDKRIQVTYATHSPLFVEARHFDQIRRLTRSAGEAPEVKVRSTSREVVATALTGVMKSKQIEKQLDGIITNSLTDALFAERVLLVEGTTDVEVFYGVADRNKVGSLEARGVEVVAAGSKSSLCLAHAIISSLNIPVYALFDGDNGYQNRAIQKGQDPKDIRDELKRRRVEHEKMFTYLDPAGIIVRDEKGEIMVSEQISENFAVFDDCLEIHLEKEWPEWAQSLSALEKELEIPLAKNSHAYRSVTLRANGEAPSFLKEVITTACGL